MSLASVSALWWRMPSGVQNCPGRMNLHLRWRQAGSTVPDPITMKQHLPIHPGMENRGWAAIECEPTACEKGIPESQVPRPAPLLMRNPRNVAETLPYLSRRPFQRVFLNWIWPLGENKGILQILPLV